MAAITTAANGNWSATGTWTGSVVPGDGDTVTLNHNVTVDVATTVGHSPGNSDAVKAIAWGTVNKVLTVNAALTIRGDVSLKGNTTKTSVLVVSGAGAGIEFDSSASASPSTTKYRLLMQDANNGYTVVHLNGTSTDTVYLRSNSGGGNAYLTRGGFTVGSWLKASYCDFTRMGDSSQVMFDFYLGNNAGAELILQHCIFDACGLLTSGTSVVTNGEITVTDSTWKNSAHASKSIVFPPYTNAGVKDVSGNVFDKQVDFGQGDWPVSNNLFMEGYVATAGTKWGSSVGNFVRRTTQPVLVIYSDLTDEFWYKDGAITNPHHASFGVTASLTVDGCIFSHSNANGTGDALQPNAPSGARTFTVRNCILLPDDDGEVQPGKLQGAGGNANVTIVNEHNTYISTNAGETGSGYGETYSGYDGIVAIKSCLAWSPNSGEASIGIRQAGTVQQSDATTWDYNAVWNPRTGSDGAGYNSISAGTIFSGASPGANDVLVSADPFLDRSRNLPTWDAALGGAGTAANALAELEKRNDRSGYNSAYSIAALVTWIKEGFQVIDPTLQNAGHDGATIGASPYLATFATAIAASVTWTGDLTSLTSGAVLESALGAALTSTSALTVPKPLAGALEVAVASTAGLTVPKPLASALGTALTSTSALTVPKPLAGALGVAVTSTAGLTVPKPLVAALGATLGVSPDLSAAGSGAALSAALAAALSGVADLSLPKPLAGALTLSLTPAAALTVAKTLAASLTASLSASATLGVPKDLAAAVGAILTMSATLDVPGAGAALATALGVSVSETGALTVPKDLAVSAGLSLSTSSNLQIAMPLVVAIGVSFGFSADVVGTLLMRLRAGVGVFPPLSGGPRTRPRLGASPDIGPET